MAANKPFTFGPVLLTTTTTTNILNPGTTTGGVAATSAPYDKTLITLKHVRVTNNSSSTARVALWKGTTGTNTVGKECIFAGTATAAALDAAVGTSVTSGVPQDWYGNLP